MPRYIPKAIEKKWQAFWEARKMHRAQDPDGKPPKKKYVLDMFPYPSGEGLHVGHPLGYIATDVVSRYFRMRGYNVLHPMGWDAFGLPAENYAIQHNIHPRIAVERNIVRFKEQLGRLGFSYDWEREINTTDPEYYRWTQWIFLQMFKRGLAYEAEAPINFCPSCKTGLANEEVSEGACERCGTKVERRMLRQWLLKITAYAERLLDDLEGLDWPERIKAMQRNWIGKSDGAEVIFKIRVNGKRTNYQLPVFTTRPDTLFGATYVVLAPEHEFFANRIAQIANRKEVEEYIKTAKEKSELERLEEAEAKTGIKIEGIVAVNPVNGQEVPVFVADYVLVHYGTGAIMAVPAHDERDFVFAKKFKLPIVEVISPDGKPHRRLAEAYINEGVLINSGEFNGLWSEDAKERIVAWLEKQSLAQRKTYWKLRDWIFSRQRYWGEPIPLVFCKNCKTRAEQIRARGHSEQSEESRPGDSSVASLLQNDTSSGQEFSEGELGNPGWIAVAEDQLPVKLPEVESYKPTGTGESPLAAIKDWVNTTCPKCGGAGRREVNTMPQWAGSSWYYLAYLISQRSKVKGQRLDVGSDEFKKLFDYWLPVDLYVGGAEHAVLHLLYARFWHKFLFDIGVVSTPEPFQKLFNQGMILGPDGQKMSKSRGNVINPDDLIQSYGADALRLYELFMGPLEDAKPWDPRGIIGTHRFLGRIWDLVTKNATRNDTEQNTEQHGLQAMERMRHRVIKKVTEDIENFRFNTAISTLMEYLNSFTAYSLQPTAAQKQTLLLLLAPFAPHAAEELWQEHLKNKRSIHKEPWPKYDPAMLEEETVTIVVQVNGKVRGELTCPKDISEGEATAKALELENVKRALAGQEVRRVVFVQNKLINLVS